MTNIKITSTPINIADCIQWVMDPACGAIDIFIGTVRDQTKEKKVVRLEFEAYQTMAEIEMRKIAATVLRKFPVLKILIHHRIGALRIGDVPVVIAACAAHRADAFDACRYAIDTLKETVPIWKKEIFEDGAVWVAAHP